MLFVAVRRDHGSDARRRSAGCGWRDREHLGTSGTVWAAAQNVVLVAEMIERGVVPERRDGWRQLVTTLRDCRGSVLSESPLIPLLTDNRPIVLDRFGSRVGAINNPEVVDDLTARLKRREFTCVVLEHDPATPAGYGWYSNVNLGDTVRDTLVQFYKYEQTVEAGVFTGR